MGFQSREAFANRRCLAQNFVLKHVSLRLKLCPNLRAKRIHLAAEGCLLSAKSVQLCFGRFLGELNLAL